MYPNVFPPADKALGDGDRAFAKGDWAAAEKAYREAAHLAPKGDDVAR